MGCATSKVDDLPAVALCRDRISFLNEAINQRNALAESHLAYIHSLNHVGSSLHTFFDADLGDFAASPVLNLPPNKKGVDSAEPESSAPAVAHHSHSNSGSHLHFHSDSDDDDASSGSLHHSGHSSPLHDHGSIDYGNQQYPSSFADGFMNVNYMKNQATPSVAYEQRPINPETGYLGETSSYYYGSHANSNPGSSYSYYGYPNYAGGTNGYYGSQPPYGSSSPLASKPAAAASSSKEPPPPPSPKASAWDYLNFFDSAENNYSPYTPSRDSREVREEEGIPDLEDEDYQHEVVKEVHGDQKFVDGGGVGGGNYSKLVEGDDGRASDAENVYQARPSTSRESAEVHELHMVDKKVVDKDKPEERGNVGVFKARPGPRGVVEVVREIQVQFERASESGSELAKILEAGKIPYRKHAAYQVSSKMLHVITPLSVVSSQHSNSKNPESSSSAEKAAPGDPEMDEDIVIKSVNLSSTLRKCYLWEKKLYDEVKAEEKMRLIHERKCKKLKRLDERGAEAHKVDSTRTLIRSLSTKIRIAIQVVDKISMKINKLRDEELWPQINELIQGLSRMWKSMLECHRSQCQAIKSLDAIAFRKMPSDTHLEATLRLERELINWALSFYSWIGAQKGYVRALNSWLLKCILYVPEETADGIVPFSPGRMGAPPLFVVCNQWNQALERISEKEVVNSIRVFAMSVLQVWDQNKLEMRSRMMQNKDLERKVRNLERDDQKIHKEIQALDKIVVYQSDGSGPSITGQVVYQSDTSNNSSLHASLQHIFEAMERLATNFTKAYEELLQRIEEDRLAQ